MKLLLQCLAAFSLLITGCNLLGKDDSITNNLIDTTPLTGTWMLVDSSGHAQCPANALGTCSRIWQFQTTSVAIYAKETQFTSLDHDTLVFKNHKLTLNGTEFDVSVTDSSLTAVSTDGSFTLIFLPYTGQVPPAGWPAIMELDVEPDNAEPDNQKESANALEVGTLISGTLTPGDEDWLKTTVQNGDFLSLSVEAGRNIRVQVIGSDGQIIKEALLGEETSEPLTWSSTVSDTIFIRLLSALEGGAATYSLVLAKEDAPEIAGNWILVRRISRGNSQSYSVSTSPLILTLGITEITEISQGTSITFPDKYPLRLLDSTLSYGSKTYSWGLAEQKFLLIGPDAAQPDTLEFSRYGGQLPPTDWPPFPEEIAVDGDSVLAAPGSAGSPERWFYFYGKDKDLYTVRTSGSSIAVLTIYQNDNTIIASNNSNPGSGALSEFIAPEEGTLFIRVANGNTGTYLHATRLSEDAYEPDNTFQTARSVQGNLENQEHTLTYQDEDWFSLSVQAGDEYQFWAEGRPTASITIYQTDGATILGGADGEAGGTNAFLNWKFSQAGTYYVSVKGVLPDDLGRYSFSAYQMTADEFEPDNGADQATSITLPLTDQMHTLTQDDADWVAIQLPAGKALGAQVSGSLKTKITLFADDGVTLLAEATGTTAGANLNWTSVSGGSVYLRVTAAVSGETGTYGLSIEEYEGGPEMGTWQVDHIISIDPPQMDTLPLTYPENQLFLEVRAGEATLYSGLDDPATITTSQQTPGSNQIAFFGDTADVERAGDNLILKFSDGTGAESWLVFIPYSGELPPPEWTNVVILEDDMYEPNNDRAGATPLAGSGTLEGLTLMSGDEDWFSFDCGAAGQQFLFQTLGSMDTYMEIYRPGAAMSTDSDDDGGLDMNAMIQFRCFETGSHAVRITAYSGNGGAYSFQFQDIEGPAADSNSTPATAEILVLGASVPGYLTYDDNDYYIFACSTGQSLTFETSGFLDTYMELFSGNGTASITTDDDGGTGTNARIAYTCADDGAYYLNVSGLGGTEDGPYTLSSTISRNVTQNLLPGAELADNMGIGETHAYLFEGLSGQTITLETHGNLDLFMTLYDPAGTEIDSNDDGGLNTNALISSTLTVPGTYRVEVRGFDNTDTGPFSVTLDVQ